jgi:exopolysaccharide biosynthesis protein
LLIQNRQIVLNALAEEFSEAFNRQLASRSVIATTAQGTLMLITIHQRVGGQGPSLAETARLIQQMGATQALNLDGGSSTALYLGGQLLDRIPSTAAQVHNGIGVFVQAQ